MSWSEQAQIKELRKALERIFTGCNEIKPNALEGWLAREIGRIAREALDKDKPPVRE